jgi:hypothetical protein
MLYMGRKELRAGLRPGILWIPQAGLLLEAQVLLLRRTKG